MVDNTDKQQAAELSRVAFKAPSFWEAEPDLWFRQIESQFIISGITSEETKYHCVVSAVDSKVLSAVRELICSPPVTKPYETLKAKIIDCFSISEAVQLKLLLQEVQLGDKRPSQLLSEMQNLSAGRIDKNIMRILWEQRLPLHVQQILSICKEPLSELALIADKICEKPGFHSVSEIHDIQENVTLHSLAEKISTLGAAVERLSKSQTRSQSPDYRRRRSNSSSRVSDRLHTGRLCWYHRRFGTRAYKCVPPCQFSENS